MLSNSAFGSQYTTAVSLSTGLLTHPLASVSISVTGYRLAVSLVLQVGEYKCVKVFIYEVYVESIVPSPKLQTQLTIGAPLQDAVELNIDVSINSVDTPSHTVVSSYPACGRS